MAKLLALPSIAIIDGLKGVIDYYVHDGVPCARSWPRSPGRVRAPAVMEQWAAFAYITQAWTFISPELQEFYKQQASGTRLSGRDLFTKSFITSGSIVRL